MNLLKILIMFIVAISFKLRAVFYIKPDKTL